MVAKVSARLRSPGDSYLVWSNGQPYMILPMWDRVSLGGVFSCWGDLPQDEVSYVKSSELHSLIVVLGHLLLVLCHLVEGFFSYFVDTI